VPPKRFYVQRRRVKRERERESLSVAFLLSSMSEEFEVVE
jgi:hypothetical protein